MKKIGICCLVIAVLLMAAPTVLADGSVTVSGGTLNVTAKDFVFNPLQLDGFDKTIYYGDAAQTDDAAPTGFPTDWQAIDPTGSGDGWHVNIKISTPGGFGFACQSGTCTSDSGHNIPIVTSPFNGNAVSTLFIKQPAADVTWVDGQRDQLAENDKLLQPVVTTAVNDFKTYQALTGTDQAILTAATDAGMGTYNFDPDFQFFVPAETYTGIYKATLEVTMITAP
jgi:hypothetical protein